MRKRLGTNELLAVLAVAGISCNSTVQAAENSETPRIGSMRALALPDLIANNGKDSACGGKCSKCAPGACGGYYYSKLKAMKKQHTAHSVRKAKVTRAKSVSSQTVAVETLKSR